MPISPFHFSPRPPIYNPAIYNSHTLRGGGGHINNIENLATAALIVSNFLLLVWFCILLIMLAFERRTYKEAKISDFFGWEGLIIFFCCINGSALILWLIGIVAKWL